MYIKLNHYFTKQVSKIDNQKNTTTHFNVESAKILSRYDKMITMPN